MTRTAIIYSPELGKHIKIQLDIKINVHPEKDLVNIEIPRDNIWVQKSKLMQQKI